MNLRVFLATIGLLFVCAPALAQNATCPDAPTGDKSNRCANTRFVINNGGGGGTPALATNRIFIGNGSNVATAVPLTNDCSISFSAGNAVIVCTKTNGVAFGPFATGTNASNLTGTVATSKGGFGADVSAATGVPIFTAGTAAFQATMGTGNIARASGSTFTASAFNGTIGATTPSTGAFTQITAAGSVVGKVGETVTNSNTAGYSELLLVNDLGNFALNLTGSTGAGSYFGISANNLAALVASAPAALAIGTTNSAAIVFGTNNTERMRIDASGNLTANAGVKLSGLPGIGSNGCVGNDTLGNLSLGVACSGGGGSLPAGGAVGDGINNISSGTGNWFNPGTANGAVFGDISGVTSSSAGLVTAYGTVKRVILPPGTYKLSSNATWPTGVEWIIPCGAMLKPDNAITVKIRGPVRAGQCQVFDHSVGGTITGIRDNRPDWWKCDGTDDSVCLNAADASALEGASNGSDGTISRIALSCGKTYIVNSAAGASFSPTEANNIDYGGCGPESTIIQGKGTRSFTRGILTVNGNANPLWFRLHGLQIRSENTNQIAQCLTLAPGGNELHGHGPSVIEDILITNCNVGIGWYRARQINLHRWSIWMPSFAVTGAANNGGGLIRLTISGTATFTTGQIVQVAGVGGVPNATNSWVITVVDGTHIDLQGSTFAGAYTSGGWLGNAIGIFFDQDVATDVGGDSDFYPGQIVCGGNGADGGVGTGFRVKAEGASTAGGATAFRLHGGMIFYHCYRGMNVTTANGANAGDFWIDPGVQCEVNGSCITAVATGAFSKTLSNWQINGIYHQSGNGQQPVFKFTSAVADGVFNLQIMNVKAQSMAAGALGRFAEVSGALNVKICSNLINTFVAQSSAADLINLGNVLWGEICNNNVAPAGIPGAVSFLVGSSGTTDDIMVTGNNARGAVSAIFNNASGGANSKCSNIVNTPNC